MNQGARSGQSPPELIGGRGGVVRIGGCLGALGCGIMRGNGEEGEVFK